MSPSCCTDEEFTLFAPTGIDFAQNGVGSATEISPLGQERTFCSAIAMSALPPKANICRTYSTSCGINNDLTYRIWFCRSYLDLRRACKNARCMGDRSCFRARLTVGLGIVCLIVVVCETPNDVICGAACCATARMLATPTTYGSEYKVRFFTLIADPYQVRLMS